MKRFLYEKDMGSYLYKYWEVSNYNGELTVVRTIHYNNKSK